jgi:ABC-type sugar transport system ATPase subunit
VPGLLLDRVSKSFDGTVVLRQLSLIADPGALVVILGPSGCGKSTLLRLISGLEIADSGRIFLDDREITQLEPQQRKTALVFQNYALYPHMTVRENLAFPLKVAKRPKKEIERLVQQTAQLLELDRLLDRRPAQLSGGQRQRVALGRGLIRQPSIFLLDEPLSNLDAALRVKMRQEIVALQKKVGITMLYVTHDQTEALTMGDKIAVLNSGQIHQIGTPEEIYTDPQDRFVASFVGTPAINFVRDEIREGRLLRLGVNVHTIQHSGEVTVGIRPEFIFPSDTGELHGTIESVEYIGSVTYLRVRMGDDLVTASARQSTYRTGTTVRLALNSDRLLFFDPSSDKKIVR